MSMWGRNCMLLKLIFDVLVLGFYRCQIYVTGSQVTSTEKGLNPKTALVLNCTKLPDHCQDMIIVKII